MFGRRTGKLICAVWTLGCLSSLSGCGAETSFTSQVLERFQPGRFTYNSLVRGIQLMTPGTHLLVAEDSLPATPPAPATPAPATPATPAPGSNAPAPLHRRVPITLTTKSTCLAGDLNFAAVAMKQSGKPLIMSLETPDGQLLASAPIEKEPLVLDMQLRYRGFERNIQKSFDITLPEAMQRPGGMFPVNLFICVDTNSDGRCANEYVDRLDQVPGQVDASNQARFNVLYFRPIAMYVGPKPDYPLTFLDLPTWKYTVADEVMASVLDNLPSNPGAPALSASLAFFASQADCSGQPASGPMGSGPEGQAFIDQLGRMDGLVRPRSMGCFVSGTQVVLASGQAAAVEQITVGSAVQSAIGAAVRATEVVAGPEAQPVVALQTSAGHRLTVTALHPMLTPKGLRAAGTLSVGDQLLAASFEPVRITLIERMPYAGQVYNFVLPGVQTTDHLLISNGLVTGDLWLQRKLAQGLAGADL